jgi:hypothetical protein
VSESQQSHIIEGEIAGSAVRFTVEVRPGSTVRFELMLTGDHLYGRASGAVWPRAATVSVDTVRLRSAAALATPGYEGVFARISRLDGELFAAFNSRDLATLKSFFTADVEFYHDRQGPAPASRRT